MRDCPECKEFQNPHITEPYCFTCQSSNKTFYDMMREYVEIAKEHDKKITELAIKQGIKLTQSGR